MFSRLVSTFGQVIVEILINGALRDTPPPQRLHATGFQDPTTVSCIDREIDALRPLLTLHAFRFIGLSFLIPGVVSPDLPATFAVSAAYGDIVAAILALVSLAALGTSLGIPLVWVFTVWGSADLLNAFFQANAAGLSPGELGATFYIPTAIVPLLLITHALMFRILLSREPAGA